MKLTVVGSLNYDVVTFVDKVPQAGETIMAKTFETHIGGKGLNQTVSMAKLTNDFPVRIIGSVGSDSFGKEILSSLENLHINTDCVKVLTDSKIKTGVATILVEANGQNRIMVTRGANNFTKYTSAELAELFPSEDDAEYVVLQNEIPDPCSIMEWINDKRPKTRVVYNPSPFNACEVPEKVWSFVDILIVNEIEALQIIEKVLPEKYAQFQQEIKVDFKDGYSSIARLLFEKVLNKTKKATVILTLGSKGCVFIGPDTPLCFEPAGQKELFWIVN